jgi:ribosomal protein L24
MRLRQLYKEETKELKPGEREPIDVKDFQDLQKLNKKISDYENSLTTMGKNLKVPKDQREQLEKIKKATQDKLDSLYQEQVKAKQESEVDGIPKPLYNLLERISKECSDIVSVYKSNGGNFIYRGASGNQDAYRGRARDDRKPADSDTMLHDELNSALKKAGVKARRDNSIFTSASYGQASNYGKVFVIFPKDGYNFSCSKKIKDFVFNFNAVHKHFIDTDLFNELYLTLTDKFDSTKKYFGSDSYFVRHRDKMDLLQLPSHFDAVGEMVSDGVIDKKFRNLGALSNVITPNNVVKNLDIFTDNISEAINIKHEITITGEYYAINERYVHFLKSYFLNNEKPKSQEYSDDLDFKLGDQVEVIKDIHIGKKGKIDYIYKMSDDVSVDTGTDVFTVSKKQLKKIDSQETDNKQEEFKKGDKVQDVMTGYSGTITHIFSDGKIELNYGNIYEPGNLKKIDDNESVKSINGYKLNDQVKIINGEGKGKAGKITKLLPKDGMVVVELQTTVGVQQLPVNTDNLEFNNSTDDNDFPDLALTAEPEPSEPESMQDILAKALGQTPKPEANKTKGPTGKKIMQFVAQAKDKGGDITQNELDEFLPPGSIKHENLKHILELLKDQGITVDGKPITIPSDEPAEMPAKKGFEYDGTQKLTTKEKNAWEQIMIKSLDDSVVKPLLNRAFKNYALSSEEFYTLAKHIDFPFWVAGKYLGNAGVKVDTSAAAKEYLKNNKNNPGS